MKLIIIIVQIASTLLLLFNCGFVFSKWKTKAHSYLFLYSLVTFGNNIGYLLEILADNSDMALYGTLFAYVGKVFIPFAFLMVITSICRKRVPNVIKYSMLIFHSVMLAVILSSRYHKLFYTSITYSTEGIFPHNVYGHGPLYNLYMVMLLAYFVIGSAILIATRIKDKRRELRACYSCLLTSVVSIFAGFIMFLTGVTKGYDATAPAYMIGGFFFGVALIKYNMMDALDLAKNYAIDNLAEGILAVDYEGKVVYYNHPMEVIYPDIKARKQNVVLTLQKLISEKSNVYRGKSIYSPSVKPLYQGQVCRGQLYVLTDVSESMSYAFELKRQKEIAEKANDSKSAFLSNMSHEIRTPMNAIVGMTEILLRKPQDEESKGYLNNIKNSGDALLTIINDILDFSKIESGKMEIVEEDYDLRTLMDELRVVFETRIGNKPVELIYELDSRIPVGLYGDSKRIRQILINLVNNAIKFTEEGYVKVVIEVKDIVDEDVFLEFSVKDSGQGIKEEDLDKLFHSYQQVDTKKNHKKEGTGLGLAICRQLVKLMGGNIGAESTYGEGSCFYFNLKQGVLDHAVESAQETEQVFIAPDARILVVDDSELNLQVFKGLFEPMQMQIETAENGKEAIIKAQNNDYDMIFMDHMMPIMDGVEATNFIREFNQTVPIIALSANATEEAKKIYTDNKMDGFAAKPIKINEVIALFRKYIPENKIIYVDNTETKSEPASPINTSVQSEIDVKVGIDYCNTEDLYHSILDEYGQIIDEKSALISKCVENEQLNEYTIEVHALKNISRTIGAENIANLFQKLEKYGKDGNLDAIKSETPEVLKQYCSLKTEIEAILGKPDVEVSTSNEIDIREAVNNLIEAVEAFDLDKADAIIANLTSTQYGEELDAIIKELAHNVEIMDEDMIKTTAARLLSY